MDKRKKKFAWRFGLALFLVSIAVLGYVFREQVEQLPIGCGVKAKILCDGLFLSGRDEATLLSEDLGFHPVLKLLKHRVDREKKSVTVSFLGTGLFRKTAILHGPLGSVLLNGVSEAGVRSWQADLPAPEPADPKTISWPTGDLDAMAPVPESFDRVRLAAAVDRVFTESDPKHLLRTRAILVVHDGKIILERYGNGISPDTRLISWSIAKSITSALVGILVGEGRLALHEPAPVPEWRDPADARHAITLEHLLRMTPGLEWYEAYAEHPVSDVNAMLFTKGDMAAFAANMKLLAPPGERWEYSTGTTMILSRIIRQAIGDRSAYWAFPRRELFNKIGMRSATIDCDGTGTFVLGAQVYATARDYARFGLLYLNDGVWQGERILPEGWVSYTVTPTPATKIGLYGAQFWLNKGTAEDPSKRTSPDLPEDMFMAQGYQGQAVIVLPTQKLVVVRLGMTYDDDWRMGDFLKDLVASVR
jgi:CubicO group peptidase (beta-lactamase class C family)